MRVVLLALLVAAVNHCMATKYPNEHTTQGEDEDTCGFPEKFDAMFINNSPFRVSLCWYRTETDEMERIADVLVPGQSVELQTFEGHNFAFTREGTKQKIGELITVSYLWESYELPKNTTLDNQCEDRYPTRCKGLARDGECEKNPGWMIVSCPVSCSKCELRDPKKRCSFDFLNLTSENVWVPGSLNEMFNRIVESPEYDTTVISSDPWLITIDDFLTDEEAEILIYFGKKLGLQRSTDTGEENELGERTKVFSSSRTSSNAWCGGECADNELVQRITNNIVEATQIPEVHYEQFQVLQYTLGQEYKVHHDMSQSAAMRAGGARILTFFLYLSDVEEGGETDFPKIGKRVTPKKGRAVLWPSVLNEDPNKKDPRTDHAALPVKKGVKYAANHWIHSHDFHKANLWGCTGSFD